MDSNGFLNLDRLKDDRGRKINLRKDAKFEELESLAELQGEYMLEIKLLKIYPDEFEQT